MADIELVIKISEKAYNALTHTEFDANLVVDEMRKSIVHGTPLPKGHGRLKDEDEIVKAIEDRVEFLRKNGAVFVRLHKDIDILGCIPKIRCEVPTIIEADRTESKEELHWFDIA
jgi:hypothetical protein